MMTGIQEKVFANGEADEWFMRNKTHLNNKEKVKDPAFRFMTEHETFFSGKTVLEIGCSTRYRLSWIKENLGCHVIGIDPSAQAIEYGSLKFGLKKEIFQMKNLESFWRKSSLDSLIQDAQLDCVIFGHCLYLNSPDQLPQIVADIDRRLKVGGFILIYDFEANPIKQPYHHTPDKEVYSYKMNYSDIFTWMPYYKLIEKRVTEHNGDMSTGRQSEDCAFSAIRKISIETAYPLIKNH